ncbi:glycoside hydrolase family 71/99-like protein [Flavobacterium sp. TSSA_36]|uniref:glycoside hydrolase family 71/99-like protein n=1 Tax=Flavobacterium sp. TSSA_36 TaxID=3447669 RepID=UPI003F2BB036
MFCISSGISASLWAQNHTNQGLKKGSAHPDELRYTSYDQLVMAGYQGWFAAQGDASQRGWHHYEGKCGFEPGCSTIDFWPDMREYTVQYPSPFVFADGQKAYLYSPYDAATIDLHFKWMQEYGIDGVHMQRFVTEIKASSKNGKRHFNQVLENALKSAKKYNRAISIMYDLSGCTAADLMWVASDLKELQAVFHLFDATENPTYLHHNGRPLVSIWGVGFNDKRKYSTADVESLVTALKKTDPHIALLLGVPYYWRTLGKDTEKNPLLLELIKKCDLIMPWAVGRYHLKTYDATMIAQDIAWTQKNGVDYIPLVFPGFSWGNLKNDQSSYNAIPRENGDFLWMQIAGAKKQGAQALYVAMFDEIDEGTAIYKVLNQKDVPLNGNSGKKFIGIENDLPTDYYLWLTGQGALWFHQQKQFTDLKPKR